MNRPCLLILCLGSVLVNANNFPGLDVLQPLVSNQAQEQAVADLLNRLIPKQAHQFQIRVNQSLFKDRDFVQVQKGSREGQIVVEGSSGVAAAWGIQSFLRQCCHVHLSWEAFQLRLPPTLTPPSQPIQSSSIGRFRYLSNVCTFSYSYVWWGWEEWEKYIDWMAMNGINLPLAHVGQEAVWQKVWSTFGLSQAEIDDAFTGPAFLAWNRMGNLFKWGGPLSQNWHRGQTELQKKILARMSSLGIVPVLPAFSGFVPRAFKQRYPQANISRVSCWSRFDESYSCMDFLNPVDPLFQKIGKAFMEETKATYGLYHAYSADSFNEMAPPSTDLTYLSAVSKSIHGAMTAVDPDAVWVMQAWLFLSPPWDKSTAKALLSGVPTGKLLLLDLYSESHPIYPQMDSYFGQPFIWNMLHNFGGTSEMIGSIDQINQGVSKGLQYPNSTMVGTGLTMEGIYQNYPLYQMMLDRSWGQAPWPPIDQLTWIAKLARERYGGQENLRIQTDWMTIWQTVYNIDGPKVRHEIPGQSNSADNMKSFLFKRPHLNKDFTLWYHKEYLCLVWRSFIREAHKFNESFLYRRDLVDLTREFLHLTGVSLYKEMTGAFQKRNQTEFLAVRDKFLGVFDDLERILATNEHFLLGRWLAQARKKGQTTQEADQYEENFRNQVTLWGPDGQILDYAAKQWAGLVKLYYKPRWKLFADALQADLKGSPYSQKAFDQKVLETVEKPFTMSKEQIPADPIGDTIRVALQILVKYWKQCECL